MNSKRYKITCKNCKAQRQVTIVVLPGGEHIDWMESKDTLTHPINSGRKRLDGQWGWSCSCGNYDIMTQQEIRQITNKQNPDPKEINQILQDLKPDKPKFIMEPV